MTYGIDAGVDKWGGDGAFKSAYTNPDTYLKKAITTTTNTGVKSLVHGESGGEFWNNLGEAYKTLAIDTAAEKGANWIGDQYVENRNQDFANSGGLATNSAGTYLIHKASHALLGCAVGAAKAGDCASGAFGGVVGEIVAEELANTSLGNNLVSPDAKKRANAKKTISTISQITSLFSASEAGLDFKTAQQTAKNAAENNALDLKHLHSIQALKVLVALNTQLVDNLTEKLTEEQRNELEEKGLNVNDLFTIEDSGGIRLRIDGTSYSLGNGGVVTNNFTHHNAEYNGGKSLGVDLSRTTFGVNVKNGINLQRIDVVNALLSIGIGEELIRVPQSNQAVRCDNCVGESQLIDGYSSQHFHFGSPILPQQAQYLINQLGDTNPYLQSGSENNLEYRIFNDNGVGFPSIRNLNPPESSIVNRSLTFNPFSSSSFLCSSVSFSVRLSTSCVFKATKTFKACILCRCLRSNALFSAAFLAVC